MRVISSHFALNGCKDLGRGRQERPPIKAVITADWDARKLDHGHRIGDDCAIMSNMSQATGDPSAAIAPMLSVRNGTKAVEFYKTAFGAQEIYRVEDPSGAVVARLQVGQGEFWVADESPEHQNFSPETLGGGTVRMVMTVSDPDAAFERVVKAGGTVVWPVANQYGWRLGRIVDPFGHHWEIGKPLDE
jgi:PhnB protein